MSAASLSTQRPVALIILNTIDASYSGGHRNARLSLAPLKEVPVMPNMRMMNNAETKSEWNRIRIMVKARFSKLSDESIDSLRGNLEKLPAKLQSTYGYGKEQADKALADVRASLL